MFAYLLLLAGVASRIMPHTGWMNFTLVGGSLIYFGARRSWPEMFAPLAIFMAVDYYLTAYAYHYAFRWEAYLTTWTWYLAAMVLGRILLHNRTTVARVLAGAILGPTSFFIVSNYAVWAAGGMYPRTLSGLATCYVAAVPFYRNDLASTTIVMTIAFGLPVLIRRMSNVRTFEVQASE